MENVREELDRLIQKHKYGYAAISRLLGRNASYIQQFIKRGSPRKLDDEDRKILASFFGVDEQVFGGPANVVWDGLVEIPVLDVEASAGFGAVTRPPTGPRPKLITSLPPNARCELRLRTLRWTLCSRAPSGTLSPQRP